MRESGSVRLTKKSKYIARVWHGVGNVFESLVQLQEKLMEDFPDKLPSSPTFKGMLRKGITLRGG